MSGTDMDEFKLLSKELRVCVCDDLLSVPVYLSLCVSASLSVSIFSGSNKGDTILLSIHLFACLSLLGSILPPTSSPSLSLGSGRVGGAFLGHFL